MVIVSEGDGTVEVCATLSAGAGVTTDIPISISLETSDGIYILQLPELIHHHILPPGTAEAGEDYDMMSSNPVFPTNSTVGAVQCRTVTIIDNGAFELNETFTVTLTVNTAGVMEGNTETTFTITDDEC